LPDDTAGIDRTSLGLSAGQPAFPDYTVLERRADGLVHLLGLSAAALAVVWLFVQFGGAITGERLVAGGVYCFGLLAMLTASTLYNLAPPGRGKSRLRQLDHAMIFVMIAGTYTPLSLTALESRWGIPLCVAIWSVGAAGIAIRLLHPQRFERASLALYLCMGWMLLPLIPALARALPAVTIGLIVAGSAVYSLGAFVHTRVKWPFHNACWHALVLIAAALHFVAIVQVLALPTDA
jgi:hemolysin III